MRKILFIVLMLFSMFVSGCSSKLDGYTEISYKELMKKIDNKETFPLVIGSSECSACATYEITMNSFIKDQQVEVFLLDLLSLSDDEYQSFKTEISFTGTPTTVFYKDGKLTSYYNRIDGAASRGVVKTYFKNNGYIE